MARQGHGFITSLPIRVVKTDQPEGVLVDVAKDGKEIGEIVFFGNICCKGYYKDPEATRKLFAGGAQHSGDLAVWHLDGSAQIQDRAKDIIISGMSASFLFLEIFLSTCINANMHMSRRREYILGRTRSHASPASGCPRSRRRSRARFALGRATQGVSNSPRRKDPKTSRHDQLGSHPKRDQQVYGPAGS